MLGEKDSTRIDNENRFKTELVTEMNPPSGTVRIPRLDGHSDSRQDSHDAKFAKSSFPSNPELSSDPLRMLEMYRGRQQSKPALLCGLCVFAVFARKTHPESTTKTSVLTRNTHDRENLTNPAQTELVTENEIARQIVDAALEVHSALGPGLLESVYETVLVHELQRRGLTTRRQLSIPIVYKELKLPTGFRSDLVVEDKVIVEIKSVEAIAPVHKKQLLTYLRLADKRLGLLINFHVCLIKHGITRVVNGLEEHPDTRDPEQ
jgi:GxxExxY protein